MHLLRILLVATFIICLPINAVFSQDITKESYVILFRSDAGVIELPNSESVNEESADQRKAELAADLGVNGEIVAILEASNGIVVEMDTQEAERWRKDDRVLSVERSIEGSTLMEPQSDYPVYRDNILTVPRVDTDEQPGLFQRGVLQYNEQTDAWHLLEFQITPAPDIFLTDGDGVEPIVSDTFPTQVFLKVKGNLSDSCQALGQINQRLQDHRFEVIVHVVSSISDDDSTVCMPVLVPFEKIVPLSVYGLSAGTYEYVVNGEHAGTFDLTNDNEL